MARVTKKGFDTDTILTERVIIAAKAAGIVAIGRYAKNAQRSEIDLCAKYKMGLFWIAEGMGDAKTMTLGHEGGAALAVRTKKQLDALGVPDTVVVYTAVDYDAGEPDVPAISNHKLGFAEGMAPRRIDLYADGAILTPLSNGRGFVAGAGGWKGTSAFLETGRAALIQHVPTTMFGVDADPVDILDESVIWYPGGDAENADSIPAQQRRPVPTPAPLSAIQPSLSDTQTALQALGHYKGRVDGQWGPRTAEAVILYIGEMVSAQ